MKKRYYNALFMLILPFLLSSCSNVETYTHPEIPVSFVLGKSQNLSSETKAKCSDMVYTNGNSSINVSMESEEWTDEIVPTTKTSWNNTGTSVTWRSGDQVGVSMRYSTGKFTNYNNYRYNITSSESNSSPLTANTSNILFPHPFATSNVRFYAYYPYAGVSSTTSPIIYANSTAMDSLILNYSLPVNQSASSTLRNCDIMCATSAVTNGTSPNVTLAFNHKMTLLTFKINSTLLPQTLNSVTVSGSAITGSGKLNLISSTLSPNTSITFAPYVSTNQATGISTYAYVDIIINPCTISNNSDGSALKVSLVFNGIIGNHATNLNISSGTFAPGTRYTYNLSVVL